MTALVPDLTDPDEVPRRPSSRPRGGDRVFVGVTRAAGLSTLVIMVLIGAFLLNGAWPVLREEGLGFFTELQWNPAAPGGGDFGIAAVLYYTAAIAIIALLLAVPMAVASALFINEYAPRRVRGALTAMVDLLAAVPSLIYGYFGKQVASPHLEGIARWLSENFGSIPIFSVDGDAYDSSTFIAAVIVALMIMPIATSICREVFAQAPPVEKEGALALGGTRWGMIRTVLLPFGRGGIIGGSMLSLGRALGETIAVAIIIAPEYVIKAQVLERGSNSVGSLIALKFGEAGPTELSALTAAGVALFAITLIVNFGASAVVARSRSGAGTEI